MFISTSTGKAGTGAGAEVFAFADSEPALSLRASPAAAAAFLSVIDCSCMAGRSTLTSAGDTGVEPAVETAFASLLPSSFPASDVVGLLSCSPALVTSVRELDGPWYH